MHTYTKITNISPESILSGSVIAPGDILRRINGHVIGDVLDYQYYSYDSVLLLELTGINGKVKLVRVTKPEGADLGLVFQTPLMDKQQSCTNKCIFCFIDQMPKGMRETLYYKDDDVRLSFMDGNYVTLTNLKESDIERIIKLRISPINVSIHTLDAKLKGFMLGKSINTSVDAPEDNVIKLAEAGIMLNCQIVCCPGINDGKELKKTIEGLIKLGRSINSVSVVPVGLTKFREGLYQLHPFTKKLAKSTVLTVEKYGRMCLKKRGSRVFYCADELYVTAKLKLPPEYFYEDYPQLENGVGMMRLFITQFLRAMEEYEISDCEREKKTVFECSVATGILAAPYLIKLLHAMCRKYGKIVKCRIYPVRNMFFGETVTVAGLITGTDIIEQLRGKKLGRVLLIPKNMLRSGDDVFLDDITVTGLSNALDVPVKAVSVNGKDFFEALISG